MKPKPMKLSRRTMLATSLATGATLTAGRARAADDTIRIGVLTDLSGVYRDVTGPTSVLCVRQAVAEFTRDNPGIKVEVLEADHLNKADVGLSVARSWFDRDGVDAITDVGNSAVAIALNAVTQDKDKIQLNTSAGTSDLTGKYCSPNLIHWTYDTWNLSHTIASLTVKAGGDRWFFVTADYNFGKSIQENTEALLGPSGGKTVGSAAYPFPGTTDFSSYLLAAGASGANVIAFANAGDDLVNCVKQSQEFGLTRGNAKLIGMVGSVTAAVGAGLQTMQGIYFSETYYWDLNDRTRSFMARIKPRLPANVLPNAVHAGNYAATLHYLKTVKQLGVARAKASGRATVEAMKAMPTDDDCFGAGQIRADGRKIHATYLFQIKTPAESKGPFDVYKVAGVTPTDQAFRPLSAGGCSLVKA
jgi:branched-chain amino acid transport system substrate-binding protein